MLRFRTLVRLALLSTLAAAPAVAQDAGPLADAVVAWRAPDGDRQARARLFAAGDDRRPSTIVLDDADAGRAPLTDEAGFVADVAARELGVDPEAATFVFRFTPEAFGAEGRKTLLLRATFRRGASGSLTGAQWRVITADALDRLTDRAFR